MNFWRHPRHRRILPVMKARVKRELLVGLAVLVQGISGGVAIYFASLLLKRGIYI